MYSTEPDSKPTNWWEASVLTTAPAATETITNMVAGVQKYTDMTEGHRVRLPIIIR